MYSFCLAEKCMLYNYKTHREPLQYTYTAMPHEFMIS